MNSTTRTRGLRAALVSCALGAVLAPAFAQAPAASSKLGFSPVIGAAVTFGGDTLVTVNFTDGSSQKVKSGGLVQLYGGVEYEAEKLVVQATVGYHVDDTSASNGSVKFVRYPVELLGFWKATDSLLIGGGVRKANNARVTSSGAARPSIGGTDFDSKAGFVVQVEYRFGGGAGVYGRVVSEEYTVGRSSVDGNHFGLGLSYRF
jgi:hypothetical protein